MKKLFVSVPMNGRTEEEIKRSIAKMQEIAELVQEEDLELIDSYIEDNPPKDSKEAIWYIAKSIEKLSNADLFIGIEKSYDWSGCYIEREIASRYGIPCILIRANYVIDNYEEIMQKRYEAIRPVCC